MTSPLRAYRVSGVPMQTSLDPRMRARKEHTRDHITPADDVPIGATAPTMTTGPGSRPRTPACKEQAGCGITLLSWHYPRWKIAYSGRKSDVVVVRTVVSVQLARSCDLSGDPHAFVLASGSER